MAENPKEAAVRAKVPLHLNPPAANRDMALAFAFGARNSDGTVKYGEWNWRETEVRLMTYIGAIRRHTDAIVAGEWIDPGSGLPHMAHIMAGAAITIDANEHKLLDDDRPYIPEGHREKLDP